MATQLKNTEILTDLEAGHDTHLNRLAVVGGKLFDLEGRLQQAILAATFDAEQRQAVQHLTTVLLQHAHEEFWETFEGLERDYQLAVALAKC